MDVFIITASRCAGWRAALVGILVLLGACAGIPADLGRSDVDALVSARGRSIDVASDELLRDLLAAPLTPESAVRIALHNNPGLQASYAELGFGAADVYEAGRIRNPVFSVAILDSDVAGGRDQVTFGLVTSFTDLLTLGARKRLTKGAFSALQQSVGAEVLQVTAAAEKAYYEYVGAQQVAVLRAQIAKSGKLSAELAKRFYDAGNIAPRDLAMERVAASKSRLLALDAEANAFAARTELAKVLGISVGEAWTAPAALTLPVAVEDDLNMLLALARSSRLDLTAARMRADVMADRLGVVNWTRWLSELDVGVEQERETDGARLSGATADWEVPVFNQHKDATLRANADLQIAVYNVIRVETDVDNSVRLANANVRNARARIDEYQTTLIPQRIGTVARAQEEVNFMLIGIFELIALKQDEYDTYQAYLEAIGDYWQARVDLGLAVGTSLPSSANIMDRRIDVQEFVRPESGAVDHSSHSMPMPGRESTESVPMDHSGPQMKMKKDAVQNEHDHGGAQ